MTESVNFVTRHQVHSDEQFRPVSRGFIAPVESSSAKRTDLSHGWLLRSLKQRPSDHPEVAHGEQHLQPRRVLGQALEAHLGKSELQLDHAERMLGLGANAGLERLQFIDQPLARTALVQCLALARPCIDPAVSAQVKLLRRRPRQGSSCSTPGAGAGGCRSRSNLRSHGWRAARSRTGDDGRIDP